MKFRALLQNRDFFCLWIGQIFSQLGDRLTQMVLIAIVATRFPGSTSALSKMIAFTIIPAFLISPFAGVLIDRWDRRRTMLFCDFFRAICVLALPLLARFPHLSMTYALVFLLFAIACFFLPARLALMPSLIAPNEVVAANSLMTTSAMIASVSSMLIGGFLVEHLGIGLSCGVTTAAYLGSAFCILILHHRAQRPLKAIHAKALLSEMWEGFQYVLSRPHAQFVIGVLFLMMLVSGAVFVVAAVVVQQALGSVTKDLGVFSVILGAGIFFGTLIYGRWGQQWSKPRLIIYCLMAGGACLLAFNWGLNVEKSIRIGWLASFCLGMAVGPVGIGVNSMIHELVSEHMWGRVFSSMGIVMNLSLLMGIGAGGFLADRLTPAGTLYFFAAVLVVVGAIGLIVAYARGARRPVV